MSHSKTKELTASDIMQRDVVVVYDSDNLQDAMNLMTQNHVTGLPVVNSKSKCVGVITASDILNYEQEHSEFLAEANSDMARHFNPDTQQWESVRITSFALEEFAEISVSEVMSPDVVYVQASTPIREVARRMRDKKIHRVLVMNDEFRLFGIISAFDFVELFAEEG
ncbi:MAG: CBS domain-containing protein [Planctomycetales bacterium]|nr:CBS domain-containing protein [Planctomycetales bacterium]NIM09618.1 CBS domain-containing protein [Planctomycetales bacterium]NIN09101.1 CBS domain-containing protein [Planctomycetales bacterium]NIN78208.1 CBS domain-containing protein [Planctomycetales bacterium]NIO35399.1 CBS domain-containing protein [Planctomycetales bacterium]